MGHFGNQDENARFHQGNFHCRVITRITIHHVKPGTKLARLHSCKQEQTAIQPAYVQWEASKRMTAELFRNCLQSAFASELLQNSRERHFRQSPFR